MTNDPNDHLLEVLAATWQRRPLHPLTAYWLQRGVVHTFRTGDSLDSALGLSAVGRRSAQRQLAMTVRDMHLKAALAAVVVNQDVSTWERCRRLAPLAAGFMVDWKRHRVLAHAPASWPAWKRHVFLAAQCDLALPTSPRGLRDVAQRTPLYSLNDGKENMLHLIS